jgi:hypothetical protein
MLEKNPRSGKDVDVTFRMPPIEGAVELYLCGDFNDWHKPGAPLRQESDGSWVATLSLENGKSYRFRYLDNQGRWHTDWEADAYVPNEFGTEDSVVDLAVPLKNVLPEAPQMSGRRRPAHAGAGAKPQNSPRSGRSRHSSGGPRSGQSGGGRGSGGNRPGGHGGQGGPGSQGGPGGPGGQGGGGQGGQGGNRPHNRPGDGRRRGR